MIRKRSGDVVVFDSEKIRTALHQASCGMDAIQESDIDQLLTLILDELSQRKDEEILTVEDVQDVVEMMILREGYRTLGKKYMLYREKRSLMRGDKQTRVNVIETMEEYLEQSDRRVNENANQGYSLGGLILNTAGKVTANYRLSHIYSEEIGRAHREASFHIHDLSMFSGYCAGWSLRQLLEEGFNGLENRVQSAPPKNLQSAVNQMINFLGTLQNERAGAQAFSSFDTYLAPFVHKYTSQLEEELTVLGVTFVSHEEKEDYLEKKTYEYVKQQMQNLIFGLNVPSRWGTQTPFTNITLDRVCPDDLKDASLFLGGIDQGAYRKTFGELEKEMRLINKVLIDVYTQGDRNGSVFTFPIPTYNITENFPRNDPLVTDLFEMTAKYGIPYFQNFLGSQYMTVVDDDRNVQKIRNPDAYTPGAVRSMCCRLQLDLKQLEKRGGGLFGSAEMTGSLGVVTINMARLGYEYAGEREGFFHRLGGLMDLASQSLEIKRKEVTKRLNSGFYPYTKRYLPSFRNHFSTIGLNGVNEAIRNYTEDKEDISTDWGQQFAKDILYFMRERIQLYQEETGNLYNLEATPAEGTTYRFAKEDRKKYPDIIHAGTAEAPYYTNSTQLPVGFTDDPFEALDYQDDLQCLYTGGTVLHVYMSERVSDAEVCKQLVKRSLEKYRLPYLTITPVFSLCPKHGYLPGEYDYCPKCDDEIGYTGQQYDIETRKIYTDDGKKLKKLEGAVFA